MLSPEDLKRIQKKLKNREKPAKGFLVAEGDSWFRYGPFGNNVLSKLEEDFGYCVKAVAHYGDTMSSIASDERQFEELKEKLMEIEKLKAVPKAVLLSGGGNDLTGRALETLLNHSKSIKAGESALDGIIVGRVINTHLRFLYEHLITKIRGICGELFEGKNIPVLVHGYGYVVPDGRGIGLDSLPNWAVPYEVGPWLKEAFNNKGYEFLEENTKTMAELIDEFNEMLESLAGGFKDVEYVDLRSLMGNQIAGGKYKEDWANELHPTDEAFRKIAKKFAAVIEGS